MVQYACLFLVKIKCIKNIIKESSPTVFYKSFNIAWLIMRGWMFSDSIGWREMAKENFHYEFFKLLTLEKKDL